MNFFCQRCGGVTIPVDGRVECGHCYECRQMLKACGKVALVLLCIGLLLFLVGCASSPKPPMPPKVKAQPQFSAVPIVPVPPARYGLWWTAQIDGVDVALPDPRLEFDVERTKDLKQWTLFVRTNQPPVEMVASDTHAAYRVGVHPTPSHE